MNDLDAFMDSISGDGLYNTARAQQLGYTKDESGHLPSVDHKTGDWLKSKRHPTAFKELYEYATNPQLQKELKHPVVNIDGHFGEDQLTYPKRYADGGPIGPLPVVTASTTGVDTKSYMLPLMTQAISDAVRDMKNAASLKQLQKTLPIRPDIEAAQRQHIQQQKNSTISKPTATPPNAMWMYPNLHGSTKADVTEQANIELASEVLGYAGPRVVREAQRYLDKTPLPTKQHAYSFLSEATGEILHGTENRNAIKKGNDWLENWIGDPYTRDRINRGLLEARRVNRESFPDDRYKRLLLDNIKDQSIHYKPNVREYPIIDQLNDILEVKKPIHYGNSGVSYTHSMHPFHRNLPSSGRTGEWVSRNPKISSKKRESTTIHEGTHGWVSDAALRTSGQYDMALDGLSPNLRNDFDTWELMRKEGKDPATVMDRQRNYMAYLTDPTEQHARIMELRHEIGLRPKDYVDDDMAKFIMNHIRSGKSSVDSRFATILNNDPKKLQRRFNEFWAIVPAIAGTQALNSEPVKEYADGGPVLPAVQNTAVTESTAVQLKRLPDMYFQKAATTRRPEKMSLIDNAAVEEDTTVERLYKKYLPENKQEVKTIQRELQTKGYDIGKRGVDGYFGDDTKRAYEGAKRNIPDLSKEIERKECSEDGCAAYVTNTLKGRVLGDAWEMMDNIRRSGGKIKYNIYEDSRFDSVKDTEQLKKVTSQVKADSKAKKDMFEIGDVVGLYNAQSDYHEVARTKGKGGAKNTHVGLVTDIRNGIPVISHNIKGKLHHDNFNNLTIAWIGADAGHKEFHVKGASEQVEDMVLKSAEQMSKALNMKISPEQVSKDVYGILKTETGAGKNVPSEMTEKRSTLARQVLGLGDKGNVSSGIAKIKGNTLSPKEKAFTGFDGKSETVGDDIKATTYLYLKHLNEAQRYAEKNPELGLSQEDIRDMAILGHNQGMSKLLNLGANSVNMTKQEEVEKLRQLREGRIRDISSTNYRFAERVGLGRLGQYLYDKEFPEGHESYVSRVRKHGADLDAFMDSILKK